MTEIFGDADPKDLSNRKLEVGLYAGLRRVNEMGQTAPQTLAASLEPYARELMGRGGSQGLSTLTDIADHTIGFEPDRYEHAADLLAEISPVAIEVARSSGASERDRRRAVIVTAQQALVLRVLGQRELVLGKSAEALERYQAAEYLGQLALSLSDEFELTPPDDSARVDSSDPVEGLVLREGSFIPSAQSS